MNRLEKAAAFGAMMGKQAFLAWGGGKAGLYPRGFGIGGELGYTNLMGLVPFPTAGIDIGGPRHGFNAGITSDPGSDFGISPYLGLRIGHPRVSGLTRNFPRGLPDVLYDKARGRTRDDAFRASYPEDKFPEYYAKGEPEETAPEGQEPVHDKPNKDDKTDNADKPDNKSVSKAAAFLAMMGKKAALDPAVANALGLGAVGLAGGGLAGGLLGYENPGDLLDSDSKPQVEFDETGKTPIYNSDGTFKTKKKSRLRAAIEGAMGGGLIGGIGGAAVGGGGTELMRVSPKIQNWLTGHQVKSDTKIPIDAVNDLKNNLISGDVNYANSKYDQLGRDKHFDLMSNGIPKDTASQLEVFGKKIGPEIYSGPDWKINLNKGQPTPVDELFSQFGPTVVNNPLSRGANSAVDWVSGLFNKK